MFYTITDLMERCNNIMICFFSHFMTMMKMLFCLSSRSHITCPVYVYGSGSVRPDGTRPDQSNPHRLTVHAAILVISRFNAPNPSFISQQTQTFI